MILTNVSVLKYPLNNFQILSGYVKKFFFSIVLLQGRSVKEGALHVNNLEIALLSH